MFCKEDRCDGWGCLIPRLKFGGYKKIDVIVNFPLVKDIGVERDGVNFFDKMSRIFRIKPASPPG